jgi:HEPN domain-containing protein
MKEFEKWFKKAENDLYTVQLLLKDDNCKPDICCFHSQQAAEKYLKAYLVSRNREFPFTHDLKKLIDLCGVINLKFLEIEKIAERLSEFGVTPRYPDAFDDLVLSDAQQAYENSLTIKDFILINFFD